MKSRVEVYRNLHYRDDTVYSVRTAHDRLVCMYVRGIIIQDAHFYVGVKGNQRVRDEKRKNVHAGVRGDWLTYSKYYGHEMKQWGPSPKSMLKEMKSMATLREHSHYVHKQIAYDPYKYKTFVTVEDGEPIYDSPTVFVGHECWALTTKQ